MKRYLILSIAIPLMGVAAFAQNQAGQQNAENQALSKALQGQTSNLQNQPQIEVVNDPITVPVQTQTQGNTQTTNVQQPVIFQNRPSNNIQQGTLIIQKQPQTLVNDSPLGESSADRLRKQRVEIEQQTESSIVERLEQERIYAEQQRATKVLGVLDEKKEAVVVAAPIVAAPVAVVAAPAAPVAIQQPVQSAVVVAPNANEVKTKELSNGTEINGDNNVVEQADSIKQAAIVVPAPAIVEVHGDLKDLDKKEHKKSDIYISGDAGFLSYTSASNVQTSPALGFTVGSIFNEHFMVEGSFLWSRGNIENPNSGYQPYNSPVYYPDVVRMDQYGLSGAFKYRILTTDFSPVVGGLMSYTYRNYKTQQCPSGSCYDFDGTSWAVDVGLSVGGEYRVSDSFTVGADLRYMMNVTYSVNQNGQFQPSQLMYSDYNGTPIEKLSYTSFLVHAKMTF